jgi:hypothetical protein
VLEKVSGELIFTVRARNTPAFFLNGKDVPVLNYAMKPYGRADA